MAYQRVGESCPENTKGNMTRGYHNLSAIPPGHSLEGFFAPEGDITALIGTRRLDSLASKIVPLLSQTLDAESAKKRGTFRGARSSFGRLVSDAFSPWCRCWKFSCQHGSTIPPPLFGTLRLFGAPCKITRIGLVP